MERKNLRTLSLVVCTFTFLLIGAAMFDLLESDNERRRWIALQEMRDTILRKYNISPEDYKVMEAVVIKNVPHKAGPQWKFAGALYFSTVVLAVIGYGHSTPSTVGGKAFCMIYAVIGIPLGVVMFQHIGERLNKITSVLIKRIKKILHCKHPEASEINLLLATGTLSMLVITSGAAMFSYYEHWSYFESLYYCFVTLTTIGFGDFVALQNDRALMTKPGYVIMSLIFILFGLCVVAASINLLVLRFMTRVGTGIQKDIRDSPSVFTLEDGGILIISDHYPATSATDATSVCSCTCYGKHETDESSLNYIQQISGKDYRVFNNIPRASI